VAKQLQKSFMACSLAVRERSYPLKRRQFIDGQLPEAGAWGPGRSDHQMDYVVVGESER